jgi:hypothetical protein
MRRATLLRVPSARALPVVLASAALALVPAAALGHGEADFTVKAAKHKDGPYTDQLQSVNVAPEAKKSLYWRVKNLSVTTLPMEFNDAATENPNPEGFRITWFKGKKNITQDVKGAGYEFNLKAGKKKTFEAVVKAKVSPQPFCLGGQAITTAPLDSAGAYFAVNGGDCS